MSLYNIQFTILLSRTRYAGLFSVLCLIGAASDVTEFVEQNLLPLVTHMSLDTLRPVKEDGRPIVVAVLESDTTPEGKHFLKKLRMAAPANRKFVFTYVVGPEWPEFVRPFYIRKATKLPSVFVWDEDTFVMVSYSFYLGLHSGVFFLAYIPMLVWYRLSGISFKYL